jgi:hypothetical protein
MGEWKARTLRIKIGEADRGFGSRTAARVVLLINFIKTSNPNGTGLPPWSSYRAGSVMKLDTPASCAPEEGRDRQTFLRDAAAALGS